jgi:hypothetical protein
MEGEVEEEEEVKEEQMYARLDEVRQYLYFCTSNAITFVLATHLEALTAFCSRWQVGLAW